jgi:hypothetical protein
MAQLQNAADDAQRKFLEAALVVALQDDVNGRFNNARLYKRGDDVVLVLNQEPLDLDAPEPENNLEPA